MTTQDTGLRASIKTASQYVQTAASKTETAALDAVERAEAAFTGAQSALSNVRQVGSEIANSIGHAGRTTFSGIVDANEAIGRYGKEALNDTLEVGRKSFAAKSPKEVVDLYVGYVSRRSQAMFSHVSELNTIAQAKTIAAWAPLGDTLRKTGEKSAA